MSEGIDFDKEHKEHKPGHCVKCDKRVKFGQLVCDDCLAPKKAEK